VRLPPAEITHLYDASGTNGVTLDGSNKVQSLNDLVGINNLVQSNVALRPVYDTNVMNGLPALLFTDAKLGNVLANGSLGSPSVIYFVLRPVVNIDSTVNTGGLGYTTSNEGGIAVGKAHASITDELISFWGGNATMKSYWASTVDTVAANINHLLEFHFVPNVGYRIFHNGTEVPVVHSGWSSVTLPLTLIFYSFGDTYQASSFAGYIAEMSTYAGTMPEWQMEEIRGTLTTKWAIGTPN
jgi:hypothetical protein